MGSTGFETPAYKLLITDIICSKKDPTEENVFLVTLYASNISEKTARVTVRPKGKKTTLSVRMVWIQGTVKAIVTDENGGNALEVSDGPTKARILNCDSAPGGDHPNIKIGSYVAVIGQIISNSPVRIRACKVMVLENEILLQSIWEEEVKDLKGFLVDTIKPM